MNLVVSLPSESYALVQWGKTVGSSPVPSAFPEQSISNPADNISPEEETVTIDLDGWVCY